MGVWLEGGYEFAGHFSLKLQLNFSRGRYERYDFETEERHTYRTLAVSGMLLVEYCLY